VPQPTPPSRSSEVDSCGGCRNDIAVLSSSDENELPLDSPNQLELPPAG
jgi:hypothetical protein